MIEHFIIGTSGHIDHGKTALIKALTDRDLDTAKEEKERGITINLGYTYFDLKDGTKAGIIDVPGHEKFLPNMVSGVCGMDMVLLVIALDEGIMPQTKEHIDIIEQLNIHTGIVVLTKMDMVEPDFAELMAEEVKEGLKGTVCDSWPSIRVSAKTGEGIEELKDLIVKVKGYIVRSHDIEGSLRLPIDRIIKLKGQGTVFAGTLLEGNVHMDEEVEIYPLGLCTRVKSIESHGIKGESATAGMRTALLLNNVKAEAIRRGMVIAKPDSIIPTTRIAAYIIMVKKTEKVLKNQQKVHVHVGTDEVIGRVKLLDADVLSEGESGFAEVVLEREIVVKRRDRFVIRFLSPLDTIGGGTVLIANSVKLKRNDEAVLGKLKAIHEDKSKEHILNIVRESDKMPIKTSKLLTLSELSKDIFDKEIGEIKALNELFIFSTKKEECFFTFKAEDALRQSIVEYFKELYTKRPYAVYESINSIKAKFFKGFEPLIVDGYLERLCEDSVLSIDGVNVRLFDRECPKDEVYTEVLEKLKVEFTKAGTDFVDVGSVDLKSVGAVKALENPFSDDDRNDLILGYVADKEIVMINDDFYTTPDIAKMIEDKVLKYFEDNEVISFASLRDLLGTSRRSAKPLMAYLDNVGITKWSGKETERVKK